MKQIYSSSVKNILCLGNFIVVNVFSKVDKFIGKILDIAHLPLEVPASKQDGLEIENDPIILVQLWEVVTQDTINTDRLSNEDEIATWGLLEVMESNAGYWISQDKVKNIVFLCHIDDITNSRFGCLYGIFNVLFVRYS